MARADFYILPEDTSPTRFACTLINKAWQQGHSLHVLLPSREEAAGMDELLWTFQDISFVPHALEDDSVEEAVPVTLGWQDQPRAPGDVLINLSDTAPASAGTYARIVEFVTGSEEQRRQARERFKQYRERGYDLHSHDMSNSRK